MVVGDDVYYSEYPCLVRYLIVDEVGTWVALFLTSPDKKQPNGEGCYGATLEAWNNFIYLISPEIRRSRQSLGYLALVDRTVNPSVAGQYSRQTVSLCENYRLSSADFSFSLVAGLRVAMCCRMD